MNTLATANYGNCVFEIESIYAINCSEYNKRLHRHDTLELIYVESGQCKISIQHWGTDTAQTVWIPAHNLLLLNEGVEHQLVLESESVCKLNVMAFRIVECITHEGAHLTLGQILCHMRRLQTMLNEKRPYTMLCDTANLIRTMKAILRLYNKYREGLPEEKSLMAHLKINELLLMLDECTLVDSGKKEGISYVIKAQHAIREMLFIPELSPEKVAEQVGITKNYLMGLFKKELGHTVMDEIRALRIEQACSRIINTDAFLTDIAFACGFNSRQSFFTAFKKHTGLSPREFREKHLTPSPNRFISKNQ